MSLRMPIGALLLLAAAAVSARDIGFGTVELAGSGGFTNYSDANSSTALLTLRPEVAFYLSPYFHIGPEFGYSVYNSEYESSFNGSNTKSNSSFGSIGAKVGGLITYSQALGRPLPFLAASFSREYSNYKYGDQDRETQHGPLLHVMGGMKIKISESFLLHVFHDYSHRNITGSENMYMWGFGFSGIL